MTSRANLTTKCLHSLNFAQLSATTKQSSLQKRNLQRAVLLVSLILKQSRHRVKRRIKHKTKRQNSQLIAWPQATLSLQSRSRLLSKKLRNKQSPERLKHSTDLKQPTNNIDRPAAHKMAFGSEVKQTSPIKDTVNSKATT